MMKIVAKLMMILISSYIVQPLLGMTKEADQKKGHEIALKLELLENEAYNKIRKIFPEMAIEYFQTVSNEEGPERFFHLGLLLEKQARILKNKDQVTAQLFFEKSEEYFQQASKVNHQGALVQYGICLSEKGKYNDAMKLFRDAYFHPSEEYQEISYTRLMTLLNRTKEDPQKLLKRNGTECDNLMDAWKYFLEEGIKKKYSLALYIHICDELSQPCIQDSVPPNLSKTLSYAITLLNSGSVFLNQNMIIRLELEIARALNKLPGKGVVLDSETTLSAEKYYKKVVDSQSTYSPQAQCELGALLSEEKKKEGLEYLLKATKNTGNIACVAANIYLARYWSKNSTERNKYYQIAFMQIDPMHRSSNHLIDESLQEYCNDLLVKISENFCTLNFKQPDKKTLEIIKEFAAQLIVYEKLIERFFIEMAHCYNGLALELEEKLTEARDEYKKSNCPKGEFLKGCVLARLKNFEDAKFSLKKASADPSLTKFAQEKIHKLKWLKEQRKAPIDPNDMFFLKACQNCFRVEGQPYQESNQIKQVILQKLDCCEVRYCNESCRSSNEQEHIIKCKQKKEHAKALINTIVPDAAAAAKPLEFKKSDMPEKVNLSVAATSAKVDDKNQKLLFAVQRGDTRAVEALLAKGADVQTRDKKGTTVLMHAVNKDNIKIMHILIKAGANITSKNYMGLTALMVAADKGNTEAIDAIISSEANVNVNDKDYTGTTALMHAAFNNHLKLIDILLAKNADVNMKNNIGLTALMLAAKEGYIEVINTLIARGADVNNQDYTGATALMHAADNDHIKAIDILLTKGANIDAQDSMKKNALMYAAIKGHENTVNFLLKQGADVDAEDRTSRTALKWATIYRHNNAIKILNAAEAKEKIAEAAGKGINAPAALLKTCSRATCLKTKAIDPKTNQEKDLMMCSRCKAAWYCSKTCQTIHWKEHKVICKDPKRVTLDAKGAAAASDASLLQEEDQRPIPMPRDHNADANTLFGGFTLDFDQESFF